MRVALAWPGRNARPPAWEERRERQRLLSAPRPIVLVGYVEGLEHAVAMTLDVAAEARRAFARRLRERRAQRAAQNGVAAPVDAAPDDASAAPPNALWCARRCAAHATDATGMLSWREYLPARFSIALRRKRHDAAQVCARSTTMPVLAIPFPEELLAAVNRCAPCQEVHPER